jgi:hypothetical protein
MTFKPRCQKCGHWHWLEDDCIGLKPERDERGRFCSFNTVCGRNCTPDERLKCQWWDNASEEEKNGK